MSGGGQWRIRRFRAADFARSHAICVAAFTPIHSGFAEALGPTLFSAHYPDWQDGYGRMIRDATAPDARERVHVLAEAGTVQGVMITSADAQSGIGEITLLAVDPAAQQRGIGRALVDFALADLAARGARSGYAGTGGDAAHAPARALYRAAGFGHAIPAVHYHREL